MNSLSTIRKLHEVREVSSESSPAYNVTAIAADRDDRIIEQAVRILKSRMKEKGIEVTSPQGSMEYFKLQIAEKKHEVFCALYLDTRHRMIAFEEAFQGTVDGCSIHPRVIAARCLELGAAAVIFAHNHPSDDPTPSQADIQITKCLKTALSVLDVRVLDHLVVTRDECVSLAQRGEI